MDTVINESLTRRLLESQFPQWREQRLVKVEPGGSDHVIYRLGEDKSVRLPKGDWSATEARKNSRWLATLEPLLPLPIPVQLGLGKPEFGFGYDWSITRWLPGQQATVDGVTDPGRAATDLAGFLSALQRQPVTGLKPVANRLAHRDTTTREAIKAVAGIFDTDALTDVWEKALAAPDWDRAPVWFHGDMHNGNLLVNGGHLSAVIDFGGLGVGDPACDLVVAWTLFASPTDRNLFREALDIDDATWARGRGWAISTGLNAYTSYAATRPDVKANTTWQITQALSDH